MVLAHSCMVTPLELESGSCYAYYAHMLILLIMPIMFENNVAGLTHGHVHVVWLATIHPTLYK